MLEYFYAQLKNNKKANNGLCLISDEVKICVCLVRILKEMEIKHWIKF